MPFDGSNFNNGGGGGGGNNNQLPANIVHFNVYIPSTCSYLNERQALNLLTFPLMTFGTDFWQIFIKEHEYCSYLTENLIYDKLKIIKLFNTNRNIQPKFIFYHNLGPSLLSEYMLQLVIYLRYDIVFQAFPEIVIQAMLQKHEIESMRQRKP